MLSQTSILCLFSYLVANAVAATSSLSHIADLQYSTATSKTLSSKPLAKIAYDPLTLKASLQSWTPPSVPIASFSDTEPQNLSLVKVLTQSSSDSSIQSSTLTNLATFKISASFDPSLPIDPHDPSLIIHLTLDTAGDPLSSFITTSTPIITSSSSSSGSSSSNAKSNKPKSKARLEREAREAARDARIAEKAALRSAKKSAAAAATGGTVTPDKKKPKPTTLPPPLKVNTNDQFPNVQIHIHPTAEGPSPKLAPAKQARRNADGSEVPWTAEQDPENRPPEKSFLQKYWWVFLIATALALGGGGDK